MFSDPIDSSDAQSFDEDDMYGSDSNVETISLKPDSMEPFSGQASSTNEGVEEAGLISEMEELCTDLREVHLMNNFSIPMGDVTEVISKTTKSKRGLQTTVKEVPFRSSMQTQSGQASHQAKVVEAQSTHPTQVMHESDTLQLIEPYETDVHDIQAEDTQPQLNGVQAAKEVQPVKRRPRRNQSASLISVEEEHAPLSGDLHPHPSQEFEDMHAISDTLFDSAGDTAQSGNPLITMVNQTGVFEMEVLFCVCPNAGTNDEQLLQAGIFPSTFRHIETAFTFSVLDDFLANNLECKTTAQQYYSKLQSITNQMFPDNVPNLYKQLLRASCQWRDLKNRIQSGLGHQPDGDSTIDGSMAIFCPACPQPGINLPKNWKERYHDDPMFQKSPDEHVPGLACDYGTAAGLCPPLHWFLVYTTSDNGDDVIPLYDPHVRLRHSQCSTTETQVGYHNGPEEPLQMAFMANPNSYKAHLHSIGATACCHGFFVPTSVVDFQKGERQINMDYSLCKALSYNMEDIPVALVMYDIMCQYGVHFQERVERSPELSLSSSLQLRTGIGLFHIHGHQDSCLPRFSPSYIPGVKQVDGEIIETLWAPLNNISRSIRGMSLAHRQEVLDAHMNHSNWKKMVRIVPSLLKWWKRMETGIDLSAETLNALNTCLRTKTKRWLAAEKHAQSKRHEDPTLMDIYDTLHLVQKYSNSSFQMKVEILLPMGKPHGSHQPTDDSPISLLGDYDEYDHVDDLGVPGETDDNHSGYASHCRTPQALDGSGMDGLNPEDAPILLPSSLGWEWCIRHGVQSLAGKEVQLRHAQASESIHRIRLALGFKSALFCTHVRPAHTQQTKTCAWNAIHSVDTNVHEHARIYSMAWDAYHKIQQASVNLLDLPKLHAEDLHVATLVLGSEPVGQRNRQKSWIWGFGHTVEDDGTWMDDFERVHWLRAKAQFERWLEEQHSIHNEAEWVPAYFHAKAEIWKTLMTIATQGSLKGHQAYASYQMHAWEELSRSSRKALTPITDAPLKHCKIKSIHLS
ncbi:hypothetical protein EDB86DRAFT_2835619 [Lactarius hatsudake]|nr:hypothetical protein EDB86DRAFT_2835619 [Lactarius hatsudake]